MTDADRIMEDRGQGNLAEQVAGWLSLLSVAEANLAISEAGQQAELQALWTPEQTAVAKAINEKYSRQTAEEVQRSEDLRSMIKGAVLQLGQTVKSASGYMATWNKPRVTWDGRGLTGFAVAHPELNTFRKVGKPSVTIRKGRRP